MKALQDVMAGEFPAHLWPFFWQKGQSDEVTRDYVRKMHEQGLRAFCVESRPHPDFLGDGWWHTVDVILEAAESLGMQIWILDDARFPTGYANGRVPDRLKKRYLTMRRIDVLVQGGTTDVDLTYPAGFRQAMADGRHARDQIVACVMVENDRAGAWVTGTERDVTAALSEDRLLHLTGAPTHASVFVLYQTECGLEEGTEDYLDPMRAEATDVLIREVYQSHFDHYASRFGTTIQAFFSDEPRFGSSPSRADIVGKTATVLPWNDEVQRRLLTCRNTAELLLLFTGECERAERMRHDYMDIVSTLYQQNFSERIGAWCRDHGVRYVGHVIEDGNAHARVGQGPGHYFRAMSGQDYAGVDIIGGQVVPGMDYQHTSFSLDGSDGEFYHYALCRLAASAAKLDPRKGGRTMCEAFGAYGWSEGLKMMKWITDHMLSHGINNIVPHAFSPAPFPDLDCPPHFYAHGNNPQFPYFHLWAGYADRLCHLLCGGAKDARVAVLYHAAAEWTCGETMLVQEPCRVLQQAQIESDIVPERLAEGALVREDGSVQLGGFSYDALVVPGCRRLPNGLQTSLNTLAEKGRVLYVGARPTGSNGMGEVCQLEDLSGLLAASKTVVTQEAIPHLNVYHYLHEDGEVFLFTNEDPLHAVDTKVTLPSAGDFVRYDAFANETYAFASEVVDNGQFFRLHLEPCESLVLASGKGGKATWSAGRSLEVSCELREVELRDYQGAKLPTDGAGIGPLSSRYPDFSGTISYLFDVELATTSVIARLPEPLEIAEVLVNGSSCGTRISSPYEYDLAKAALKGHNEVEVRLTTTLGRSQRDFLSQLMPYEEVGLTKPIKFYERTCIR